MNIYKMANPIKKHQTVTLQALAKVCLNRENSGHIGMV